MSLDAAARRRFARQLLLAEIGEDGQLRLAAAGFRSSVESDPDAYGAAADYLERAGCAPDLAGVEVRVPRPDAIDRFAGSEALRGPAALIAGAFSAVEHIKETLGLGPARDLPAELRLGDGH